jgi:hypothetical protein
MISGAHTGKWSIPGGRNFPGQLIIDNKEETIHLEIFGSHYIEGTDATIRAHPDHFHRVIFGNRPTCTLYNCHWAGTQQVGDNLYRITYRIEYVFSGFHFLDSEISVRGGTFSFAYLATWYDGDEFHDKLEGKRGLWENGHEVVENTLGQEELQINPELTLVFWDEVNKQIEEIDISYRVVYSKYVRFQYKISVPFTRLLKDAFTFLKLISFCFAKPLNCLIIYVYSDNSNVTTDDSSAQFNQFDKHLINVNNYTLKKRRPIPKHTVSEMDMAFSRHTLSKEELNDVIIRWFANEKLFGIYEYYLDSNNWFQNTKARLSNVMFNNRFLNLIQGLEAYLNEFYPKKKAVSSSEQQMFSRNKNEISKLIIDATLKEWYERSLIPRKAKELTLKERLAMLILDLKPDLQDVFEGVTLEEFPQSASKFRNQLSHGTQEINLGARLHEDYLIAQVLLGACILKSLGVNKLGERLAYYSQFEDAAYQIIHFQNQRMTP